MSQPDNSEKRSAAMSAISLGTNMTVGMIVFAGVGYYIDQRTGGGSAFTLAGLFLGLFYGGYEVWKMVRRINEETAKTRKP